MPVRKHGAHIVETKYLFAICRPNLGFLSFFFASGSVSPATNVENLFPFSPGKDFRFSLRYLLIFRTVDGVIRDQPCFGGQRATHPILSARVAGFFFVFCARKFFCVCNSCYLFVCLLKQMCVLCTLA